MKPTIDDIKLYFKDAVTIQHPNTNVSHNINLDKVWDNGTGGWNSFTSNGVLILWSGITKQYSKILTTL